MFAGSMLRAAAAPGESVSSLRSNALRRAFPRYYRRKLSSVVADLIVLLIAVRKPKAATPLGVLVVVAGARYRWHARPNSGRKAALPPGTVSIGSRALHDPNYFFSNAERFGDVFKSNHFLEPQVCVMGMDRTARLFNEKEADLASVPLPFNQFIPGGLVRWKRDAQHDEYRRLFQHAFGQPLIRGNSELIDSAVSRMLESIAGSTDAAHPLPYIRHMVFELWVPLFFGIGVGHDRFDEILELYEKLSLPSRKKPRHVAEILSVLEDLLVALLPHSNPHCAASLILARHESEVLEPALLRNLIFTLETSRDDVSGLLMWVVKHASDNPAILDQLRREQVRNKVATDSNTLSNRMVSESLRLEQSEHLFRRAQRDISFEGFTIRENWLIRACTHESHRDPTTFERPNEYDPDRFLASSYGGKYAPFGVDGRACVGETLTRRVACTLLEQLAGYDVEVTADGPREMGGYRHWAPSDEFRFRLIPRS
jgi:cytochrome P450